MTQDMYILLSSVNQFKWPVTIGTFLSTFFISDKQILVPHIITTITLIMSIIITTGLIAIPIIRRKITKLAAKNPKDHNPKSSINNQ